MKTAELLYVITGATGNVGGKVADGLLSEGKRVRVLSRSAERLRELAARGAEACTGSVANAADVERAFEGAHAAFLMVPGDIKSPNVLADERNIVDNYAQALRRSDIKHAVALSSIGAHLPARTGLIQALRYLEQRLHQLSGVNVLFLRAAYFMENLYGVIPSIAGRGVVTTQLRPDLRIPMIATRDIAAAAVTHLVTLGFKGKHVRELLGQRGLTLEQATRILGASIDKPELFYVQALPEDAEKAMAKMGVSADFARLMSEMERGFNEGYIGPAEERLAENTTPTTFEQFAREFARVYGEGRQKAA